ncbi:D-Ala-D-Ala carboxypeptidase family metallohydrolase [Cupriavidus necator]
MKLSANFSLEELTHSDWAVRHGVDNSAPDHVIENLKRLAQRLETVRTVLGFPVYVSSGYRSPVVNKGVGGARTSDHLLGFAADIRCPEYGSPLQVARRIVKAGIPFNQVIHEAPGVGGWVHFSIEPEGVTPERDILTAQFGNGPVKYIRGLQ